LHSDFVGGCDLTQSEPVMLRFKRGIHLRTGKQLLDSPVKGLVEESSAPVIASLDRASRLRRGDLKLRGSNEFEIATLRRPASRRAIFARNDDKMDFFNKPFKRAASTIPGFPGQAGE